MRVSPFSPAHLSPQGEDLLKKGGSPANTPAIRPRAPYSGEKGWVGMMAETVLDLIMEQRVPSHLGCDKVRPFSASESRKGAKEPASDPAAGLGASSDPGASGSM